MEADLKTGAFAEIRDGAPVAPVAAAQLKLTIIGDQFALADLARTAAQFDGIPVVLTIVPEDASGYNRQLGEPSVQSTTHDCETDCQDGKSDPPFVRSAVAPGEENP